MYENSITKNQIKLTTNNESYVSKTDFAQAISSLIANNVLKLLCNENIDAADQEIVENLLNAYKEFTNDDISSDPSSLYNKIKMGVIYSIADLLVSTKRGDNFKKTYNVIPDFNLKNINKTSGLKISIKNKNDLSALTHSKRKKSYLNDLAEQNTIPKKNIVVKDNPKQGKTNQILSKKTVENNNNYNQQGKVNEGITRITNKSSLKSRSNIQLRKRTSDKNYDLITKKNNDNLPTEIANRRSKVYSSFHPRNVSQKKANESIKIATNITEEKKTKDNKMYNSQKSASKSFKENLINKKKQENETAENRLNRKPIGIIEENKIGGHQQITKRNILKEDKNIMADKGKNHDQNINLGDKKVVTQMPDLQEKKYNITDKINKNKTRSKSYKNINLKIKDFNTKEALNYKKVLANPTSNNNKVVQQTFYGNKNQLDKRQNTNNSGNNTQKHQRNHNNKKIKEQPDKEQNYQGTNDSKNNNFNKINTSYNNNHDKLKDKKKSNLQPRDTNDGKKTIDKQSNTDKDTNAKAIVQDKRRNLLSRDTNDGKKTNDKQRNIDKNTDAKAIVQDKRRNLLSRDTNDGKKFLNKQNFSGKNYDKKTQERQLAQQNLQPQGLSNSKHKINNLKSSEKYDGGKININSNEQTNNESRGINDDKNLDYKRKNSKNNINRIDDKTINKKVKIEVHKTNNKKSDKQNPSDKIGVGKINSNSNNQQKIESRGKNNDNRASSKLNFIKKNKDKNLKINHKNVHSSLLDDDNKNSLVKQGESNKNSKKLDKQHNIDSHANKYRKEFVNKLNTSKEDEDRKENNELYNKQYRQLQGSYDKFDNKQNVTGGKINRKIENTIPINLEKDPPTSKTLKSINNNINAQNENLINSMDKIVKKNDNNVTLKNNDEQSNKTNNNYLSNTSQNIKEDITNKEDFNAQNLLIGFNTNLKAYQENNSVTEQQDNDAFIDHQTTSRSNPTFSINNNNLNLKNQENDTNNSPSETRTNIQTREATKINENLNGLDDKITKSGQADKLQNNNVVNINNQDHLINNNTNDNQVENYSKLITRSSYSTNCTEPISKSNKCCERLTDINIQLIDLDEIGYKSTKRGSWTEVNRMTLSDYCKTKYN
ncbi:putative uncharacterized protein DDB_G0286901 [Daktulosphaira vitifoliae]|uniref:putative uncharacterized protein DDB_G0286901 n=1 Tax=Daktulosphaira vitifoliae TaxID=58002 RepID=UPI0021AADF27|nr:putative uncharacterized protein DDB_G0286901 [Daktulosphaira vitifoliae]